MLGKPLDKLVNWLLANWHAGETAGYQIITYHDLLSFMGYELVTEISTLLIAGSVGYLNM